MPCPEANTPWLTARYTTPPARATRIAPLVFRKIRRFIFIDCKALQGERGESPSCGPQPAQGFGVVCRSWNADIVLCRGVKDWSQSRVLLFALFSDFLVIV